VSGQRWVQARVQIITETEDIDTTLAPEHGGYMKTSMPGSTTVTIRIHPAGSDEVYEFEAIESARRP